MKRRSFREKKKDEGKTVGEAVKISNKKREIGQKDLKIDTYIKIDR